MAFLTIFDHRNYIIDNNDCKTINPTTIKRRKIDAPPDVFFLFIFDLTSLDFEIGFYVTNDYITSS